jgi:hypothetical protein
MILSLSFLKGFVEIRVPNCPVDHRKLHSSSKYEEKWQKPEMYYGTEVKDNGVHKKNIEDIKYSKVGTVLNRL